MTRAIRGGYEWNPLKKYPRNTPCYCGSKIKFKHCHLNEIQSQVIAGDVVGARTGRKHWLERLSDWLRNIIKRGE